MQSIRRLRTFMKNPVNLANELAALGSDVQRVHLGPKPFVFVFHPEAIQSVLVKRAPIYPQSRHVFDRIQPVTGRKGVVQLQGPPSRQARAQTAPLSSSQALQSARAVTEIYTDRLIDKLKAQDDFDVSLDMNELILGTALKIFLDMDVSDLSEEIASRFRKLNHLCGIRMRSLLPTPLAIPTPRNREIQRLHREIRTRISNHLSSHPTDRSTALANVFVGHPDLIDHAMTFLFAGHETTASSLSFALLLLAKNPSYQDRIAEDDEEMTLAVYKESLRLYPPAYMLARESSQDDELMGVNVRKSDQVIIPISSLHRDPRFFQRPNDFYPERFLTKTLHPYTFIPFGAGQKSCLGERLAYLEATIVLKTLCKKFRITSATESIETDPHITLNARPGQRLGLRSRTHVEGISRA